MCSHLYIYVSVGCKYELFISIVMGNPEFEVKVKVKNAMKSWAVVEQTLIPALRGDRSWQIYMN